ncbi:MAG: response regulator [Chloroflexi bacterium]|nr:response regulator [Chloroflexota bacterium]
MQWQLSPSVIAEAATALALFIVAIFFPWRDLNRRASITGSILLIVAALWILTHSLEIGTPMALLKAYLMGLQLILGLIALTLWLMYIVHYVVSEKWQTNRIYALFGIAPVLAILAVTTNGFHGLMWTAPGLNMQNPYLPLEPAYGPVYWICMAYMVALIAFGCFLILNKVFRQNNFRTWEPWTLIFAVVLPIVAAFLEVTGFTQPAGLTIGITPFSSSIGTIALVWSLPRFHLQKIIPVARHTVFQRIGDGVVVLNMQNRVVDMNPAAEHLAGYTVLKALGLPAEQIWPNWPTQAVLSEPASTVYEGLVLTCAGEQRTYNLHIYTITDDKDRPLNKVVLLIDTTERKRAEEESRRLREKAEISSRLAAVGEMAAGIAHEINNPLTGVLGFSQLLAEKQDLPAGIKKELKIIVDGSNRVKDIVKRMLTFARQTEPMRTGTSMNELIGATLDLRRYVLTTANIEVIRHLDPNLPRLFVDPGEMQQVFLNLIVNAEYAMKKAHDRGTLTITTEKKDDHIRISFKDDGIGMNEEVKAKLFHPFFTTKEVGEGTGLGLGLSRSIVLEHGGTIEAESQPGQGATFIITLPITHLAEKAAARSEAVTPTPPGKVKSARVLIVDDEEAIRLLVSTILSQNECAADATGDAGEAFAKLESTSYDIVLMDIRMPGMSGMEMYARVIDKHPELTGKVIFMTGDSSDSTTRAFLEQNKLTFLTKPFDIETLLKKVNGLL